MQVDACCSSGGKIICIQIRLSNLRLKQIFSLSLSLDKTMPVFSWSKIMLNRYLQVLVVVVAQMAKHSTKGSGFQSVWNPASFLQYFKEICLRNRHIFVNVSSLFQICSLQKNSTVILLIELECRRTVILIHL